jgi:hypothetical protein
VDAEDEGLFEGLKLAAVAVICALLTAAAVIGAGQTILARQPSASDDGAAPSSMLVRASR